DVPFRRGDERAGIVVDEPFAPQVAKERARRGELAGGRGPGELLLVQLAEEAPERLAIELGWLEIALLQIGLRGGVADELRQIALVGAHGVRRRVAIKSEKLQEAFEMFDHESRSADRRARAPTAPRCAASSPSAPCRAAA